MDKLRVALLGSRTLGATVLSELTRLPGIDVVLVAKPGGDMAMDSAVSELGLGVRSHSYWNKQSWALEEMLGHHKPDIVLAAHWQHYVTRTMQQRSGLGVFAYHPSLLPRHRGIDAVKWTIHCKDPIAGGTVYKMDGGLDEGPIALQDWCHVNETWTASDLWRESLFPIGVKLLKETAKLAEFGSSRLLERLKPQDEQYATFEERYKCD